MHRLGPENRWDETRTRASETSWLRAPRRSEPIDHLAAPRNDAPLSHERLAPAPHRLLREINHAVARTLRVGHSSAPQEAPSDRRRVEAHALVLHGGSWSRGHRGGVVGGGRRARVARLRRVLGHMQLISPVDVLVA